MRQEWFDANRRHWDEVTPVHAASAMYDLDRTRRGEVRLRPWEIEEVGAVDGKSLLHLQCHIGTDTISWARLGACVTALDLSPASLSQARELAAAAGVHIELLEGNVYDAPAVVGGRTFDVVYTSHGVLCWLPDAASWAEVAASLVAPGGVFYISEFHPFAWTLHDERPELAYSYFEHSDPLVLDDDGTYADRSAPLSNRRTYEWGHAMSEIVQPFLDQGLLLELFRERPFSLYQSFPFLERRDDGYWWFPGDVKIPLMYSLRLRKPGR